MCWQTNSFLGYKLSVQIFYGNSQNLIFICFKDDDDLFSSVFYLYLLILLNYLGVNFLEQGFLLPSRHPSRSALPWERTLSFRESKWNLYSLNRLRTSHLPSMTRFSTFVHWRNIFYYQALLRDSTDEQSTTTFVNQFLEMILLFRSLSWMIESGSR